MIWRAAHPERVYASNNRRYQTRRDTELIIVAQSWGDDIPRCRANVTPELSGILCAGKLQIDHLNGNGDHETFYHRTRGVLDGTRKLDDLRILCELHQAAYAIHREDSVGGSDPDDWQEPSEEL